jgi:hypothetical protein
MAWYLNLCAFVENEGSHHQFVSWCLIKAAVEKSAYNAWSIGVRLLNLLNCKIGYWTFWTIQNRVNNPLDVVLVEVVFLFLPVTHHVVVHTGLNYQGCMIEQSVVAWGRCPYHPMEEMRKTKGGRDVYKGRFFQSPGLAPTFQVRCAPWFLELLLPWKLLIFLNKNDFLAGLHGTCGWSEIQAPGTVRKQCSRGKDSNLRELVQVRCPSRLETK